VVLGRRLGVVLGRRLGVVLGRRLGVVLGIGLHCIRKGTAESRAARGKETAGGLACNG
jgi:hypothetical protein